MDLDLNCNLKFNFDLFSSLTIHPNKLLVATGQTAGHDNREGKVRFCESVPKTNLNILKLFFSPIVLASHPSVEFGQLSDRGRAGIGRVRTVHQLSVVFQSGKSIGNFRQLVISGLTIFDFLNII